ncbi:PAS domain S-box protein [Leptospira johnsonii]|uniref:histidine kinase n=2 Tax=Leptospira johnsonii TaxID=1917820 RepID=A0A2P2D1K7_9LEPT|nr:PAS domain S-box protein [Leptospira johnsonii]
MNFYQISPSIREIPQTIVRVRKITFGKKNTIMNQQIQKTILLVEDEPLIGLKESAQLQEYGYKVIHALNEQEAMKSVENKNLIIDLILMDIDLGQGTNGTDVARNILKNHDIPILFLSSHVEREIVRMTEDITTYGYMVKNSSIAALDASIKMAFRLYDAHSDLKKKSLEIETKRRELEFSEKRYRRLFESAKDGILILDAKTGLIVDVNPFLMQMLGYSKEELLSKKIWEINAFKNINYSKQLFKELQDKEYVRYSDLPLETFEGEMLHVEFVSNVYLVDNDKVIQCNIRDITERNLHEKILENDIDNKKALLRELQHRTKNSFSLITSLISLRSIAASSAELKNTLEELNLRVQSISDLYSLLYETESIDRVQLTTYCNKVIESIDKLSDKIEIHENIERTYVSAKSAAIIGMILVELLSNAVKYAFPNGRKGIINIELHKIGDNLQLTVEDNGIGLPENFDIAVTKTLGLHLVSLMTSQLNGNIEFPKESGTKIVIDFPV